MNRILLLTVIALLWGCAHTPKAPRNENLVSIGIAANLQLQFRETATQEGGLDRMYNAANLWRPKDDRLLFATGTSFVPGIRSFSPKDRVRYQRKARYLVDALNKFKLAALSPSIDDLALTPAYLKGLKKLAHFPWVSANLWNQKTKRLLFPPYVEIVHEKKRFYVIGLSHQHTRYPLQKGIVAIPPGRALIPVLRKLKKKKPGLIVVLNSLNEDERFELERHLDDIHLIVGGRHGATDELFQMDKDTLLFNPESRGREIATIEMDLSLPLTEFFNEKVAKNAKDNRRHYISLISTLNGVIKRSQGSKKRYTSEKQEYKDALAYYEGIPQRKIASASTYHSRIILVDDRFNRANDLTEHIERWEAKAKRLGYIIEE